MYDECGAMGDLISPSITVFSKQVTLYELCLIASHGCAISCFFSNPPAGWLGLRHCAENKPMNNGPKYCGGSCGVIYVRHVRECLSNMVVLLTYMYFSI